MEDTIVSDRVLGRRKITAILPHRGRMLLLDRVEIASEKVRGELRVTEGICEGHAAWDGELVLKGSDLLDMSAQLLGVFLRSQYPQLLGTCVVREYGGAKFRAPIRPFEKISIEVAVADVGVAEKKNRSFVVCAGENFVVRDRKEGKIKAEIRSVKLVVPLRN